MLEGVLPHPARILQLDRKQQKDALMRLIQQITLLLRISAAPDCMKEYEGGETPLEEMAVVEAPCQMAGRSCSHRRAAYNGVGPLRRRHPCNLPERPLFVVTGSTSPFPRPRLREHCGQSASCSARSRAFPPASTSSLSTRSSFRRCTTTTPA